MYIMLSAVVVLSFIILAVLESVRRRRFRLIWGERLGVIGWSNTIPKLGFASSYRLIISSARISIWFFFIKRNPPESIIIGPSNFRYLWIFWFRICNSALLLLRIWYEFINKPSTLKYSHGFGCLLNFWLNQKNGVGIFVKSFSSDIVLTIPEQEDV